MEHCKLRVCSFGFALGITWGLGMLFVGLGAYFFSYGNAFIDLMGSVYIGVDTTLWGAILGGIYGLVDGFIGGVIIAWFYNMCLCCCKK